MLWLMADTYEDNLVIQDHRPIATIDERKRFLQQASIGE